MAFERLKNLGEEKFTKVLNLVTRGQSCRQIARYIQQAPPEGWGDLQDLSELALMQALNRLRHHAAERAYGPEAAKRILAVGKPNFDRLANVSVQVLARMEELSEAKRELVLALLKKATTEVHTSASINAAVDTYRQILLDLQKLRFDLGLDEFKGPVGSVVRGASITTTTPDGMSVQKQVFEAVNVLEQIFDARKIPRVLLRE